MYHGIYFHQFWCCYLVTYQSSSLQEANNPCLGSLLVDACLGHDHCYRCILFWGQQVDTADQKGTVITAVVIVISILTITTLFVCLICPSSQIKMLVAFFARSKRLSLQIGTVWSSLQRLLLFPFAPSSHTLCLFDDYNQ